MKLSIITVVYNDADRLKITIDSLQKHFDTDEAELILVDGESSDETLIIAEDSILSWRIFSQRDIGIYDAMNFGLSVARGEFVWFVNAGDVVLFSISSIIRRLKRGSDIYYSDFIVEEHKIRSTPMRKDASDLTYNHQNVIVRISMHPEFNLAYKLAADYDCHLRIHDQMPRYEKLDSPICSYDLNGASSRRLVEVNIEKILIKYRHTKRLSWIKLVLMPYYYIKESCFQ